MSHTSAERCMVPVAETANIDGKSRQVAVFTELDFEVLFFTEMSGLILTQLMEDNELD